MPSKVKQTFFRKIKIEIKLIAEHLNCILEPQNLEIGGRGPPGLHLDLLVMMLIILLFISIARIFL